MFASAVVDVSAWLKSLRLHKYSPLFQQMTYSEMMNLTDDWLESRVSHLSINRMQSESYQ